MGQTEMVIQSQSTLSILNLHLFICTGMFQQFTNRKEVPIHETIKIINFMVIIPSFSSWTVGTSIIRVHNNTRI